MRLAKSFLWLALLASLACSGADGLTGPAGPTGIGSTGATGPAGAAAVVDYQRIYDTVRVQLPPLIAAEVTKQIPAQANLDSIANAVAAKLPPALKGEKGDSGAKGDKGDSGAAGATGATGPTGPAGPKGDKGDTGTPGKDGVLSNTISGDLTVLGGRVCIGGPCRNDIPLGAGLQLFGDGDSNIYLEGNRNGTGPQLSGHVATGIITVSGGDGGLRFLQNWNNGTSADGIRGFGSWGGDSQANWSMQQRKAGELVYGQDVVFVFNHETGLFSLQTWIPAVKLQLCQTPAGQVYSYASDCR